uniref:Mediator of RNA polymerase II transcription subunit 28 n=1 Tax=Tetranychus urticae TaxID=32264 RepID=T1KLB1_TETUR
MPTHLLSAINGFRASPFFLRECPSNCRFSFNSVVISRLSLIWLLHNLLVHLILDRLQNKIYMKSSIGRFVENHRAAVEHLVPKFADNARAMELYFVRWKTIFGNLNPDELVKEEICEMEAEIRRKDALLAKIYEKLGEWKTTFTNEAMEQKKDQNEENASLLN